MALAGRLRLSFTWLLQILMAVAFLTIGAAKFHDPAWERNFARWSYPSGSHMVVGVIEALGGALVLVPGLSSYAAIGLSVVMVGAAATHAMAGQPWTRPLPHMTLLLVVAALRWRSRRRFGAPPSAAAPARS